MHRQRGIGFFGIIALIAIVGFIGLLAVRMVPVYMEANTVRNIMQSMQDDRTCAVRLPATSASA